MSKLSRFVPMILVVAYASIGYAQSHHGISSEGRDFYIGYMPNLPIPAPPEPITPAKAFILICSEVADNRYTLNFFDDAGNEVSGSGKTLMKGRCDQIPIPEAEMRPSRPGSQLEFKAAHITSRYPISVSVYLEGSAA